MSDVQSKAEHGYSLDEAKLKASELLKPLCEKYNLIAAWQGDALNFHGVGVSGSVQVCESEVQVSIALGALLKIFQEKIQGEIDHKLKTAFV